MKKTILFLMILVFVKLQAQNYQISFAGANMTVSSVKVENLTQGTNKTLNESDILNLTVTTGIVNYQLSIVNFLHVYPNPMTDNCMIEFDATAQGEATIGLYDIAGKRIMQVQELLTKGKHSFSLSGIGSGIYVLKVESETYTYSAKILSTGNNGKQMTQIKMIDTDNNKNRDSINVSHLENVKHLMKGNKSLVDMQYTKGDQLKFTGFSGINSGLVWLIPTQSQTVTFDFVAGCGNVTDADGNVYSTVQIGTQCWMKENLNIGTRIDGINSQGNNGTIEKYCYNDSIKYCNIYGGLYQWDEIMQYVTTEKAKGICPTGWHIPSHNEWTTLERAVCSSSTCNTDFPYDNTTYGWRGTDEGGKLKEAGTTHWESPNTGATNSSGFSALPGGYRYDYSGDFGTIGYYGIWWSATEIDSGVAWNRYLGYSLSDVYRNYNDEDYGFSVRCVRD